MGCTWIYDDDDESADKAEEALDDDENDPTYGEQGTAKRPRVLSDDVVPDAVLALCRPVRPARRSTLSRLTRRRVPPGAQLMRQPRIAIAVAHLLQGRSDASLKILRLLDALGAAIRAARSAAGAAELTGRDFLARNEGLFTDPRDSSARPCRLLALDQEGPGTARRALFLSQGADTPRLFPPSRPAEQHCAVQADARRRRQRDVSVLLRPVPPAAVLRCTEYGGLSEVGGGEMYSSAVCASVLAGEAGIFGHSPEELADLLAGRRCNVSPNIGAYGRDFSGDTSPADLDCALSLIHLLFTTSPKADGAASLAVPLRLMREYIRSRRHDPFWNFKTTVKRLNYGDSYYLKPLTERDLDRVRPAAALEFFAAAFANPAAFTICLVGALPEDDATLEALVVQYLGTIPATDQPAVTPPSLVTPLPFAFPPSPIRQEVRVTMPEPQAAAQMSWPLTIASSLVGNEDARAVSAVVMGETLTVRLACRILETRLLKLLRFRFGDVYSVTVNPYYGMEAPSATPPLHGDCAVSFSCDPDAAWRLVELALDELAVLQAHGPSAEDCTTAVELERRAFELSQAENSCWLERLLAPYQVRLSLRQLTSVQLSSVLARRMIKPIDAVIGSGAGTAGAALSIIKLNSRMTPTRGSSAGAACFAQKHSLMRFPDAEQAVQRRR